MRIVLGGICCWAGSLSVVSVAPVFFGFRPRFLGAVSSATGVAIGHVSVAVLVLVFVVVLDGDAKSTSFIDDDEVTFAAGVFDSLAVTVVESSGVINTCGYCLLLVICSILLLACFSASDTEADVLFAFFLFFFA